MQNKHIEILDSSLRDGAQGEGIVFSVDDKLNICKILDSIGVDFIEAGNPTSNPKDEEFFARTSELNLKKSKLVAFGSTRRIGEKVENDKGVAALLAAGTDYISVFGKSWDFHVTDVLKTTLDENLSMIYDTLKYLKENGKTVLFDAEHFYDGYKRNRDYALKSLKAALDGGAEELILCDTNGGTFPTEIYDITKDVIANFPNAKIGVHLHNDIGCAVASCDMAVKAGAMHIQGTFIGFGERCGNANLSNIIANLQLKQDYNCIPDENIKNLTPVARHIAEIANMVIPSGMPYVGKSAFAHKGGMHVDGVKKNSASFEHISPDSVGNSRNILLSEVSGKTAVAEKLMLVDSNISKDSAEAKEFSDHLKQLEYEGYQFESAEASVLVRAAKFLKKYNPMFDLLYSKILSEQPTNNEYPSSAITKVRVGDTYEITAAEGDGPVHALDKALRKALDVFYPTLRDVHLIDYKVRVMDSASATAALVRVFIESTDGKDVWTTVGVSTDIIEASLIALVDSIEYKLMRDNEIL